MSRRRCLAALAALPLLAFGSPGAAPRPKRLAMFAPFDNPDSRRTFGAFARALAARGWTEGPRLQVLATFRNHEVERLDAAVESVVAWRPDVIVTDGSIATASLMRVTREIPIVASVWDPVAMGFAHSLVAPGKNFTGLSQSGPESAVKRVELVVHLVPKLRRLAYQRAFAPGMKNLDADNERAAREAGIEPVPFDFDFGPSAGRLLETLRARGAQAVYLLPMSREDARRLAPEGIRLRLPLVSGSEEAVEAGLLASLESDGVADADREAVIVEKILLGADPATIPIFLPDKFRVVVNRRTAEAIGLKLSGDVLLRADRIIE